MSRKFLCAFGRHDWVTVWKTKGVSIDHEACTRCPKTRPYVYYIYI
ncbi:hypothetical protein SEA_PAULODIABOLI_360 [Microbacterium phage PauloDiaboli]|nr:hypothetical protein SEA_PAULODIABOLI_5 [Microbacterium phage PauloDiaboli]QIG58044.1 hypothetical protein SEA_PAULODIABOLI_360 [Microbacterium phage PauloDiaboli]